ncbi:hypothetical protein DFH08DRAFT_969830 [Mycena albidolilacea]|uniref:Uncharacterized protein n=1 Tax=Mycena albidolilacea TaxID=1033008 RepID=A0AAD6ZGZ6_9AGAR|nr:hypothetical protein DFH08DRAFT_969830 [Mycena albidolilacea]
MSSPPYDAIAHAHRMEPPTGFFLLCIVQSSRPRATMWVFEHPGRTCSAQMRIRIPSRAVQSVLASGWFLLPLFPFSFPSLSSSFFFPRLPDSTSSSAPFVSPPPVGPLLLPAWPERCLHDAERDAFSDHQAVTRVLDALRAYDFTTRTALPFFVAHAAFLDPACAAVIFSRVTTLTVLRAHLRAPQLGCVIPPPCATPLCPFTIAYAAFLASRPRRPLWRSPTLPLDAAQLSSYHHWPAQRPRWLFLVGGAAFFCLRTTTVDASPALPLSPSHTWPPPSPVLTAQRTWLGASRRPHHLRQPLHRVRRVRRLPARPDHLSAVPTLRSKPAPGTPHGHDRRSTVCSEADAITQREYDARHHHRTQQHALRLFPITHATFVLSPSPPTHHRFAFTARLTACTYLDTVPTSPTVCAAPIPSHPIRAPRRSSILSAIPPPSICASCMRHKDNGSTGPGGDDSQRDDVRAKSARAHGGDAQPPLEQQLCCEGPGGNQDLTVLPLRVRGTSGCLVGTLTHGKRMRARGGRVIYSGSFMYFV